MKQLILENSLITIFGATGDLTKRKLIPALYQMFQRNEIDHTSPVLCIGRKEYSREEFIETLNMGEFIKKANKESLNEFTKLIHYYKFNFSDKQCSQCESFCQECSCFSDYLNDLHQKYNTRGDTIFYLATPPSLFRNISEIIKESGLMSGPGKCKVAFEKPFGEDLKSARDLNKFLQDRFTEKQIYRIDHYLGKALVQDVMTFRFSNSLFERIWNREFIDHVQISIAESVGVESRAQYYDKSGAIKDMVQNHMIQLLAIITMEAPTDLSEEEIKNKKVDVLSKMKIPSPNEVVRGQYVKNENIKESKSYVEEKGVDHSVTWRSFGMKASAGHSQRPMALRPDLAIGLPFSLPNWRQMRFGDVQ